MQHSVVGDPCESAIDDLNAHGHRHASEHEGLQGELPTDSKLSCTMSSDCAQFWGTVVNGPHPNHVSGTGPG